MVKPTFLEFSKFAFCKICNFFTGLCPDTLTGLLSWAMFGVRHHPMKNHSRFVWWVFLSATCTAGNREDSSSELSFVAETVRPEKEYYRLSICTDNFVPISRATSLP